MRVCHYSLYNKQLLIFGKNKLIVEPKLLKMANNRELTEIITDISNEIFNKAMLDAGVSYQDTTTLMSGLSQTCKPLNSFFKQPSRKQDVNKTLPSCAG